MGSVNNIILLLMIGAACVSDLKTKKVSNQMLVIFFAVAILMTIFQSGLSGLWLVASSIVATVILALPLYLMKVFGGGDFKLLISISPLLPWRSMIMIIAAAFIWGAILGLFHVVLRGQLKQVFSNLKSIGLRNPLPQTQLHMIPFTFAIFFGFLSQLICNQIGWSLI